MYQVTYKDISEANTVPVTKNATNQLSFNVSGLLPNREFNVSVVAINAIGKSEPASRIIITGEIGLFHYFLSFELVPG